MIRKLLIAVLSTAAFGIAVPAAQAGVGHHPRCHHHHVRPAPKPKHHKRCRHHAPPPRHHKRPCKKQQRPSVRVTTTVNVSVTTTVFVQ
jgi:hypothetical protein